LAILISLGGALMRPDGVLCVGPGNHCHFETIVGASCDEPSTASDTAPRPQDGCPKGSKDLRLGVDTHRADNNPRMAASAPRLAIASGVVDPAELCHRQLTELRLPGTPQSRILTTILRC
jgi:hypothetical protein